MSLDLLQCWPSLPSLCFAGLALLLLHLLYLYCWNPASLARTLRIQGLPVLPYFPFLGNIAEFARLQRAAYASCLDSPLNHRYLSRIWAFHGKYSSIYGKSPIYWLGRLPALNIVNADDAKLVLSTNYKSYEKFATSYVLARRVLGSGLVTAEGEDWENQRRILNPAFSGDKLKAMSVHMFASAVDMANSWRALIQQNGGECEVDVSRDLRKVTADIIARTSFGSNYEEGKAVFEDQEQLADITFKDFACHTLIPGYRFVPTARNRLSWKLQRRVKRNLRRIVEKRIKSMKEEGAGSYGDDLLGLMLAANKAERGNLSKTVPLTTEQVMDECKTFFFAGHETTASLLSWTMMLMAAYPEWQERAREEVRQVYGELGQPNHSTGKLKIVEMILNESLRLYPPISQLVSRVRKRDGNGNGSMWEVPMGVRLTTLAGVIQRDRNLWGEDADEFKPDRFKEGWKKQAMHGFLPFGLGPHTCIGQGFAMLEAKLVLVVVLQCFRFSLSPTYRHAPQLLVTLRPQHGLPLFLSDA